MIESDQSSFESSYNELISFGINESDLSTMTENDQSLTDTFHETLQNANPLTSKEKGMNKGTLIGVICGCVGAVAVASFVTVFMILKKRHSVNLPLQQDEPPNIPQSNSDNQPISDTELDMNFWL